MAIQASAQVLYNPVVDLIGDGTTTVAGTGYTAADEIYFANFANQVTPVASNNYSGTASGLVTENSSASGELTNNQEVANAAAAGTQYLGTDFVFNGGYAGTDGTATVTSGNATREVGYMTVTSNSLTPTIGATQPGASLYAASDLRGVVGIVSSGSFWAAGTSATTTTAGFQYVNTPVQLAAAPLNTRTVQIRNGQLYGSSDTGVGVGGPYVGISAIGSGTPTTGGQTALPLFQTGTSSTNSPYAFSLFDDSANTSGTAPGVASTFAAVPYNVAYITDAGNASAAAGGIEKWVYNSANGTTNGGWTQVYKIFLSDGGAADTGNFGLAAQLDPTTNNVYLWSTTNEGLELQQFTDPLDATLATQAVTTDATEITLATAPTNDLFRGVALAVPEPASAGLLGLGALGLMARRRPRAT